MIKNEKEYLEWIQRNGVGKKDKVASSPKSYISYLKSVSRLIGKDIFAEILFDENCVLVIENKLKDSQNKKSISKYKSALRQYVRMAQNT